MILISACLWDNIKMQKKFPYRRLWQARLLNKKLRRDAIPIDISVFKHVKGNIRAHGYRRARKRGSDNIRAYIKDTYGRVMIFINLKESTIESKTETWGGLMGICSDFDLRSYRSF